MSLEFRQDSTGSLPVMTKAQVVFSHYSRIGFGLKGHPVEIVRQRVYSQASEYPFLNPNRLKKSTQLVERTLRHFSFVSTIGLIVCRQGPSTAKGVAFLTLEDEYGMINVTIPIPIQNV
jgi:error-prone DNA polymerase